MTQDPKARGGRPYDPEIPEGQERLIDPDCRDGKCGSCVGYPCEHSCHDQT